MKIDVKKIQLLNQFEQIASFRAKTCFFYNDELVFIVPSSLLSKAISKSKLLSQRLKKKIKLVSEPTKKDLQAIKAFIEELAFPYKLKQLELKADKLIIYPLQRQKALLIGKEKRKKQQLEQALTEFFGIKELVIK